MTCGSDKWPDTNTGTCGVCDPKCTKCTGPAANQC